MAVWTGHARDTRPEPDFPGSPLPIEIEGIFSPDLTDRSGKFASEIRAQAHRF
jgi:hypothetical protein